MTHRDQDNFTTFNLSDYLQSWGYSLSDYDPNEANFSINPKSECFTKARLYYKSSSENELTGWHDSQNYGQTSA